MDKAEARTLSDSIRKRMTAWAQEAESLRRDLARFSRERGYELLGFDTFKQWAERVCPLEYSYAHKLMLEGEVAEEVGQPLPVRHLRTLTTVPPGERKRVLNLAENVAQRRQSDLTPAIIREAAGMKDEEPDAIVDCLKQPVPSAVAEVFGVTLPAYNRALQSVQDLKDDIARAAAEPGGSDVLRMAAVDLLLSHMRRELMHGRPYAACRCAGRGCEPCSGRGWLTRKEWQEWNSDSTKGTPSTG